MGMDFYGTGGERLCVDKCDRIDQLCVEARLHERRARTFTTSPVQPGVAGKKAVGLWTKGIRS
jgi:hypothetical protein